MAQISDFQRDMEVLINEGWLAANDDTIRFKFVKKPEIMRNTIDVLQLSNRPFNALMREHVDTLDKLLTKFSTLHNLNYVGALSVKEIRNKFLQYYYSTLNEEERKQFWRDCITETIAIM